LLKIIIIEDEKPAARRLQRLLDKNGITVNTMLHSVSESIGWLKNNPNPDLIFLDIQLSDGLSFEIFEQVDINSAIIFTTAYDEYTLRAFKLNSIDYLLKPIDIDELETAINKFKQLHIKQSNFSLELSKIKDLLNKETTTYKKRFTTQIGQHLKMIEVNSIECFYSEDKTTFAYVKSGKSYPLDGSLDSILLQINPKEFYRVNRKCIISLNAIKDIISYTNSRLQIKLNSYHQNEIIVSREKVKDFKLWIA
jgi:DNA-binding LytR/AlgR family response regulator